MLRDFVSTSDTADMLDCIPARVRQLIHQGKLKAERIANVFVVFLESIEEYQKIRPSRRGYRRGTRKRSADGRVVEM